MLEIWLLLTLFASAINSFYDSTDIEMPLDYTSGLNSSAYFGEFSTKFLNSTEPEDLLKYLMILEYNFWKHTSASFNNLTQRKMISLEFIHAVHEISNTGCTHISSKSKWQEIISTNYVKILIKCMRSANSTGTSNFTFVPFSVHGYFYRGNMQVKFSSNDWESCWPEEFDFSDSSNTTTTLPIDKNIQGLLNGKGNCGVAIIYNLPLRLDKVVPDVGPLWETFLILDGEILDTANETFNSWQREGKLQFQSNRMTPYSVFKCGYYFADFSKWDLVACQNTSSKFIKRNPVINSKNSMEYAAECNCSKSFGLFKLIYVDLVVGKKEEHDEIPIAISFRINGFYSEITFAESEKTRLEGYLTAQILMAVDNEGTNDTYREKGRIVLSLSPVNNSTLVSMTFKFNENKNGNESITKAASITSIILRMEALTTTGVLNLYDLNGTLLETPLQLLVRSYASELGGTDPETIFLWILFSSVVVITTVLILIAIRKHQKEREDTVHPIPSSELGETDETVVVLASNSPVTRYALMTKRNNDEIGTSMTTILSDSVDSIPVEQRRSVGSIDLQHLNVSENHSDNHEINKVMKSHFQVLSHLPNAIDIEDVTPTRHPSVPTIYYIPTAPENEKDSD